MFVGSFDLKETDPVLRATVVGRSDIETPILKTRPFLK